MHFKTKKQKDIHLNRLPILLCFVNIGMGEQLILLLIFAGIVIKMYVFVASCFNEDFLSWVCRQI